MGIRIVSQNELSVQTHMETTRIEDRKDNAARQGQDGGSLRMEPEAELSISDAGRRMFDENGKYGKWLSDEELIELYGALPKEEETMKFQYGYDEEFDSISSSFGDPFKKFIIGRYAGTGIDYKNIDYSILDKMAERYSELKQEIETDFSDEEKEQRLSELDLAYKTVFEKNIVKPIWDQIDSSMSFYNRGTLTYISGSQSYIEQFTASEREMNGIYKRLGNVNSSLKSILERGTSWWIANTSDLKKGLANIISSMIEITGTPAQKEEYASMEK